MRQLHKVLLLVLAINLLPTFRCEDDVDELYRVKNTLRDCRSDLNNMELSKDRCSEAQKELQTKIKSLESKIKDLGDHEHLLLGAKEETDLVRKELAIAQDRLVVCDTNSKAHESRESICKQDLELAKAELSAAAAREAEAEKALRQNDCTAARRDLRTYRDMAEQAAIDAEALKKKIADVEAIARIVPALENKVANARETISKTEAELKTALSAKQTVKTEMEAKTGALQAELDATKKALESLLASLDTRQKYEALLEEHEKEWLPHWLREMLHSAAVTVHATATSAVSTISGIVDRINSVLSQIWDSYIMPVLTKIDSVLVAVPGWSDIRSALLQSAHFVISRSRQIGLTMVGHVLHVEMASEGFALNQLQRIDSLKSIARHEVVHFVFWGVFASLTLPIALTVLKFLVANTMYFLRPGSATVRADADEAIEDVLGYKFSKTVGKKRLALLGSAVAQTLAAEKALTLSSSSTSSPLTSAQEESTLCSLMQQMIEMGVNSSSLANAAEEIGLGDFIQAGPGARSDGVAQEQKAQLYKTCLGAVYLDSDFDIKAAREVWNRKGSKAGAGSLKKTKQAAAPVKEASGSGDERTKEEEEEES